MIVYYETPLNIDKDAIGNRVKTVKLLGISGSLREGSYNSAILEAIACLDVPGVEVVLYQELGSLPLFNPDTDEMSVPEVARLKSALDDSDGLIIASPEYAHGISGAMKNALDWLVAGSEFVGKPVMLINTSPRAHHAFDALQEIVQTMSGNLIKDAFLEVPLLGSGLNASGILDDESLMSKTTDAMQHFLAALEEQRTTI